MDIQVSSNFERLLFELNHRDGGMTAEQLLHFRATGSLTVEPDQFDRLTSLFSGARVDDEGTLEVMAEVHRETGLFVDPHTAVGIGAARVCRLDPSVPMVTLATADPAKFPDAVEAATGVRPPLPPHLADLLERPERTVSLPRDLDAVKQFVQSAFAR
jgi:threonine synthase